MLSAATAAVNAYGTEDAALNHLLSLHNNPNGSAAAVANTANSSHPVPNVGEENVLGSQESVSSQTSNGTNGESSTLNQEEERDAEMEDELTEELQRGDALSDYDIEVTIEGEAINEYLGLINSAEVNTSAEDNIKKVPSSE